MEQFITPHAPYHFLVVYNFVSILYCFWDIQRRLMACPWKTG